MTWDDEGYTAQDAQDPLQIQVGKGRVLLEAW